MAQFQQAEEAKDPSAVLDYVLDLAAKTNGTGDEDYLQVGETITVVNSVVTNDPALVVDSFSKVNAGTAIEIWLSAGVDGVRYAVTTNFSTSIPGRVDERTFLIKVKNR